LQQPTTEIRTAIPAPTPSPTLAYPDLVVARQGEPEDLVRRAVAALGGMERFVPDGSRVVVKPNICHDYFGYEYAATTNPWVVGTVVKMCFEAGAKQVLVLDYPFGGLSERAYVKSGIQEQVLAAGGELDPMPSLKYKKTDIPQGKSIRETSIYDEVLNADVLINVPIAKTHGLAILTLGLKNVLGVIRDRGVIHRDLGQRVADLNTVIRPTLTVLDAVRILVKNGPTGGNLEDVQKLDTIIASSDIVAVDSYATAFFNMKPDQIPSISAAAAMGIGTSDLASLRIEEITVAG